MKDLIIKLSGLFAPSGYEDAVREYIRSHAESLGAVVSEDGLGNLIAEKRGKSRCSKSVVFAAYMDETGIMTKNITDEGLVKFGVVGDTETGTILGKQVLLGDEMLRGVVGLKPIHLTPEEERKSLPKAKDLYIDAGAESAQWMKEHLEKGDYGVFYGPCRQMGRNIHGKAMGRSVTCAVLLKLMEMELPADVTFVFTAQRQVGSRGAYGAGFRLQADHVVVLDICPGGQEENQLPGLGKGPVAPSMDKGAMFDTILTEALRRSGAAALGKTEMKTDAGAFQRSGKGTKIGGLLCPAKYISAPCQMIDTADAEKMVDVLKTFLEDMEGL